MAMKRSFYTVDGEIVGESTSAGAINYATDALGSVTGTLVNGQLQNTYAYKPYGALLASTGSGTAPRQGWLGSLGYRPTGRVQSDHYVRARHYGVLPGRWSAVDPLWPPEPPYVYASGSPVSVSDLFSLLMPPILIGPMLGFTRQDPAPLPRPSGTVQCDHEWKEYVLIMCRYYGWDSSTCQSLNNELDQACGWQKVTPKDFYRGENCPGDDQCKDYAWGEAPWPGPPQVGPDRPPGQDFNYQDCLNCCEATYQAPGAARSDNTCIDRYNNCVAMCDRNRKCAFMILGGSTVGSAMPDQKDLPKPGPKRIFP